MKHWEMATADDVVAAGVAADGILSLGVVGVDVGDTAVEVVEEMRRPMGRSHSRKSDMGFGSAHSRIVDLC